MQPSRPLTRFLKECQFVAFDTETTGLFALSHSIVEIAAVRFRLGSDETETFQELIDPGRQMPPEVIEIHGITDEMVSGARKCEQVLPDFISFCGTDSILIAHNAPFDISFLSSELARAGMKFGPSTVIDTVDLYRKVYPDLPGYSLLGLSLLFEVADSQDHRALADAQLVRKLFRLAAPRLPAELNRQNLKDHLAVYDIDSFQASDRPLPDRFAGLETPIENGERIEMVYAKPGAPPHSRIVQPGSIQRTNGIAYLIAHCELAGASRTFRLDRIETYRVVGPNLTDTSEQQ